MTEFDRLLEEQRRWLSDPMLFPSLDHPFVFPSFTRLSFASQFSHEEQGGNSSMKNANHIFSLAGVSLTTMGASTSHGPIRRTSGQAPAELHSLSRSDPTPRISS